MEATKILYASSPVNINFKAKTQSDSESITRKTYFIHKEMFVSSQIEKITRANPRIDTYNKEH